VKRTHSQATAYVNPQGMTTAHGACRTLDDMTPDEVAALQRKYGCPIRPVAPTLRTCARCGKKAADTLYLDTVRQVWLCRMPCRKPPPQ
jgi:hypothetical protein